MELWMSIVLSVVVAVVLSSVYRTLSAHRQSEQEAAEFMAEAESLYGLRLDASVAADYTAKKKEVFERHKKSKHWSDERFTDDLVGNPDEAWQRELDPKETASLRAALIHRTVSALPIMAAFQQEVQPKYSLYQRDMLTDKQWKQLLDIRDAINKEGTEIRHEAECLQQRYGLDNTIFQDATTFHQHIVAKKMQQQQQVRMRDQAQAAATS